jgi:hypothetical protein
MPTSRPASTSCASALQAPARQIATNAGAEASIVAGKILDNKGATYGYNAQTGEYGDMIAMGIVDPVKVVRTALQDAASVAGLLVTTEAMIAEAPKKDSAPAACRRHARRRHGRHGRHGLLRYGHDVATKIGFDRDSRYEHMPSFLQRAKRSLEDLSTSSR